MIPVAPLVLACLVALATPAHARTLAEKLHRFIDTEAFPTSGEFIDPVTPLLQRIAIRGVDFPVTATASGFSYRFDFAAGAAERVQDSLGPVFAERPNTIGERQLQLGVSYLYAELTDFDGDDFAEQLFFAGTRRAPFPPNPVFTAALAPDDFSLVSHVAALSATYGISERWDANVLLPLVATSLELGGVASVRIEELGGEASTSDHVLFDESAVGVGDLLLRTKYRFLEHQEVQLASILALRIPTGEEGDFHGLGDVILTPGLVASYPFRSHDLHANVGVDLNADDIERARARYGIGLTIQPWQPIAFMLDVLGSSSFVDDEFSIPAPAGVVFPQRFGLEDLIRSVGTTEVVAVVPRSDLVDLAIGLKASLGNRAVVFASAIVPLTDDGLRPAVVPAAGVSISF